MNTDPLEFIPVSAEEKQIFELIAATPAIEALVERMRPMQPEQRAAIYARLYTHFCPVCGEAKADCICNEAKEDSQSTGIK